MNNTKSKEDGKNKPVTIIVNGREEEFEGKNITFDEVVILAFGTYEENEFIVYTMTYSKGEGRDEGSMVRGDEVKVKKGMIFNVTRTDKS